MKLGGTVEQRLRELIHPALYDEITGDVVTVKETTKSGEGVVRFRLPAGARHCVQWKFEDHTDNRFRFLRSDSTAALSAADGAFTFAHDDGEYEAHVIELKKTINPDAWAKASDQMRWSVVRLLALGGLLDVKWRKIVCYTGYRRDALDPRRSPDPALAKLMIGDTPDVSPGAEEVDAIVRKQREWLDAAISLDGLFEAPIPHRKVQLKKVDLDATTAEATVDLAVSPTP